MELNDSYFERLGEKLSDTFLFYFVYVLRSSKDGMFYTGYTSDLSKKIKEHNDDLNTSTKHRRPFKQVCFVQGTPYI